MWRPVDVVVLPPTVSSNGADLAVQTLCPCTVEVETVLVPPDATECDVPVDVDVRSEAGDADMDAPVDDATVGDEFSELAVKEGRLVADLPVDAFWALVVRLMSAIPQVSVGTAALALHKSGGLFHPARRALMAEVA